MLTCGSTRAACQTNGLSGIDVIVLPDILQRQMAVADCIVGWLYRHELPGTTVIANPDDPAWQHRQHILMPSMEVNAVVHNPFVIDRMHTNSKAWIDMDVLQWKRNERCLFRYRFRLRNFRAIRQSFIRLWRICCLYMLVVYSANRIELSIYRHVQPKEKAR